MKMLLPRFLDIGQLSSIYFPSTMEAALNATSGVSYGNYDSVHLTGYP